MNNKKVTPEDLTRVNNDVNGNPRYVIHFLDILSSSEYYDKGLGINRLYELAVKKANKIGGRKYSTKSYGGGIVFQSYSLPDLCKEINMLN